MSGGEERVELEWKRMKMRQRDTGCSVVSRGSGGEGEGHCEEALGV